MKQLLQHLDSGETNLLDVPTPRLKPGHVLVQSVASVISVGTERMLVEFGRAGMIGKARRQPDKVRDVLGKVQTDGLVSTIEAVRAKLDAPLALGYCNAGTAMEVGERCGPIQIGDRVVTNGPHAEHVLVGKNLVARIPSSVSFEAAAFTPLAAIGLQGIRNAEPALGETAVVYGLGLIGLLTVQLLRANGCTVIGIDRDSDRLALAEKFGARAVNGETTDAVVKVMSVTGGRGADVVLMTLASKDDGPMRDAAGMSRQRGRIVLVGTTGLGLSRDLFYKKEVRFSVSCSYGPGRYDTSYEDAGHDYPFGYVRWTEQRNFEACLRLMETKRLDPESLVSHRFSFSDAETAYDLVHGTEPSLGIVLEYPERDHSASTPSRTIRFRDPRAASQARCVVGVIGAGNFATRVLVPALAKAGVRLHTVASSGGTAAAVLAKKFDFENATSDVNAILKNPEINAVFVLTRHDSHGSLTLQSLEAGKHVFVEKPLALTEVEVKKIGATAEANDLMVMVGFNRRFSELSLRVREFAAGATGPLALVMTINAGHIPTDHWTQSESGGGRIVGEACHWIDLSRALIGVEIENLSVSAARSAAGRSIDDISSIILSFRNGSTSAIHYLSNGAKNFPKERIEVFADQNTVVIDNWRRVRSYGRRGPNISRRMRQDKGHQAEVVAWCEAVVAGGPAPIPLAEIIEVSRWSITAAMQAKRQ